jgi:hypothetical protein
MANLYRRNFRKRQLEDRIARDDSKKMPLTGAERNSLYRERKKRKREDAARPSTSADISDSDPPVDVDVDAPSEELSMRELWEARWKTSNTRFKNMFTNNLFGMECSSASTLRSPRHGCAIMSPLHRSADTNAFLVRTMAAIPDTLPVVSQYTSTSRYSAQPFVTRSPEIDNCMQCVREFGEVCLTWITMDSTVRFILCSVYILVHPCSSSRDIGMLLFQSLAPCIANNSAHPFLEVDADVPIVLCGDITQNMQFVDFMKNTFNIDCATRATTGTTLGNACLDLIFTRSISVQCLNYISYFSYHRPVLNRVVRRLSRLPSPNQDNRV